MIDDTNCTPNYRRNLAHDIRRAISQMDQYQKEQCLTKIRVQAILCGQPHDPDILKYVTTLLNDKEPRNGISGTRR